MKLLLNVRNLLNSIKVLRKFIGIVLFIFCFYTSSFAQNIGINDNGATPNAKAVLDVDVSSNDKGVLIPRLTTVQRTTIAGLGATEEGLTVYDETTDSFWFWDGAQWVEIQNSGSSGTDWSLTGNAGTTNGTNFIGTTDNQALDIRTNNVIRTRITTKGQIEVLNTGQSVFVGEGAGANDDLSTNQNTFVGYQSGTSNTTGFYNTASGVKSLYFNTTGQNNTANGNFSLFFNTTGGSNTATGFASMYANTTGDNNTAIGFQSLYLNTTGYSNVAMGVSALYNNTTTSNIVAVGDSALFSNHGIRNTAVGSKGLFYNTSGYDNTASGYQSMYSNTLGQFNTASGYQSLFTNHGGFANTASGYQTLFSNVGGNGNTASGFQSLYSNTAGSRNIGLGYMALYSNTTGDGNIAIGYRTGLTVQGSRNIIIGDNLSLGNGSNQLNIGNLIYGINMDGSSTTISTGNIGIGVKTPAERLEVNGAIKLASTSSTNAGTIRWSGTDFEGYDGTTWKSLTATGGGTSWSLTGNAGTSNGTNFIGTSDNQALDIRTNNVIRARITQKGQIEILNTGQSVFIGEGAGANDDLSLNNNVSVGYIALQNNTTGFWNAALGSNAMNKNTTGSYNVAIGLSALYNNTTGSTNTAVGMHALFSNTTGIANVASGLEALNANTTGQGSVAIGFKALHSNLTGNSNTSLGSYSLSSLTSGNNNVAIGFQAGDNLTSGTNNIIIGANSIDFPNSTGSEQLNIGNLIYGIQIDGTANTLSTGKIGIAVQSPQEKLDVNGAIKIGTTTTTNTGTIRWSGTDFEGYDGTSWQSFTTTSTSPWTTTGSDIYRATGSVGIGTSTPSSSYTLDIQGDVRLSPASSSADFIVSNNGIEPYLYPSTNNYGYIGSSSNKVYQGHFSYLTVYTTFTNLSDRRIKENITPLTGSLNKILQLNGKNYDLQKDFVFGNETYSEEKEAVLEKSRKDKIGFIAQEIEEIFPQLVRTDEETGLKSVDYIGLIPVLVEAVKEQNEKIEALQKQLNDIQK